MRSIGLLRLMSGKSRVVRKGSAPALRSTRGIGRYAGARHFAPGIERSHMTSAAKSPRRRSLSVRAAPVGRSRCRRGHDDIVCWKLIVSWSLAVTRADIVSRNGPRPREQYGYLSAGEILYNYDVIIPDGNLVGTRCLEILRGSSQGFAK
jgi:hypothetical protein